MIEANSPISEHFAKQMLASLYKLDAPLGQLDAVVSGMQEGEAKRLMIDAVAKIMFITVHEMMAPIYRCHQSLGRVSEPGPWLQEAMKGEDEARQRRPGR